MSLPPWLGSLILICGKNENHCQRRRKHDFTKAKREKKKKWGYKKTVACLGKVPTLVIVLLFCVSLQQKKHWKKNSAWKVTSHDAMHYFSIAIPFPAAASHSMKASRFWIWGTPNPHMRHQANSSVVQLNVPQPPVNLLHCLRKARVPNLWTKLLKKTKLFGHWSWCENAQAQQQSVLTIDSVPV